MSEEKRNVLVTTSHRGVFFGELVGKSTGKQVVLRNARMAIYWTSDCNGVLGLASVGPVSGCRIGATAPRIELREITSVVDCSEEAVKAWRSA